MTIDARELIASATRGKAMPSTVIREASYRPETRELQMTFVSGRIYVYSDVPENIYAAYRAAPSKGTFFNIAIRGRYSFREIGQAPQERKRSAR